ncbi:hypothetical protein EYR38_010102 [Pleurotus pulmonarius]|nr:hypothetical protein EYR38_010102 [Pleurotus pulmonarius]
MFTTHQQPRIVARDHRQDFNALGRAPCLKENFPITMKTTPRHQEVLQNGIVMVDALYRRPPRAPCPPQSANDPPIRTPCAMEVFMVKDILGKGAFGLVYLAEDRVRGSRHAIKTISKQCSPVEHELVLNEQRLMRELGDNPWFVNLDASWHDNQCYYLAMPFVSGGDLDGEVRRCGRLAPDRALFYTAELYIALQTLHGLGIMHRDVKLANILLKGDGHIVLSDFGLSKRFAKPSVIGGAVLPWSWMSRPKTAEEREMYYAREGCGTPQTMAPEIIQGKPYTFEVDYWALAVVMYIMLIGRAPFGGRKEELLRRILYGPLVFQDHDVISPSAKGFLRRMLEKDPDDRLLRTSIKKHAYFAQVDWEKFERREVTPPYVPRPYVPSSRPAPTGYAPGIPFAPHEDPAPGFNFVSATVRSAIALFARSRSRVASAPVPALTPGPRQRVSSAPTPARPRSRSRSQSRSRPRQPQPAPPLPRARVASTPTRPPAGTRPNSRQPPPPVPPLPRSCRTAGPSPAATALPTPPASRNVNAKVAGSGTATEAGARSYGPKVTAFLSRWITPSRTGGKSGVVSGKAPAPEWNAWHSATSVGSSVSGMPRSDHLGSPAGRPAGKPAPEPTSSGFICRIRLWTRKIWSASGSTSA